MRTLWIHEGVAAPAERVWDLLVEVRHWPEWGPSVRRAELEGGASRLGPGSRGRVWGPAGPGAPFRVTAFEDGRRWSWEVAGVGATDHVVESVGPDACRLGFGVPWPAAPYLAVCRVAAGRIRRLAEEPPPGL